MGFFKTGLFSFAFTSTLLLGMAGAQNVLAPGVPPVSATPTVQQPDTSKPPATFDEAVDRLVARENVVIRTMKTMHPLVETYIQTMKTDPELGLVPESDDYFLGKLDLTKGFTIDQSYLTEPGFATSFLEKFTTLTSSRFNPKGFASMVLLDTQFDRNAYEFQFIRREFLGDIRCLVIDISPKKHSGYGRFMGRIWVEDQDYNIVRFNGSFVNANTHFGMYNHFDSWRINMKPGLWLPAYVYSEETDLHLSFGKRLRYKAQTRLWGYNLSRSNRNEEFSEILVDSDTVHDQASDTDLSPVESQRAWERMAEDNALERLQLAGLLARDGDVDRVLETVVNNLEVTNNLEIQPEVRCRVLLTAPLETFSVGHTIVISRGMLDVLPDEASLAMVLAHELAHIVLQHGMAIDSKYAFNDRMQFKDNKTFENFSFNHSAAEEEAADKKALDFLTNSPYKDKLSNAGLFLKAVELHGELHNLIRAHLGDGLASKNSLRMSSLMNVAPKLQTSRTDQVAALPLGGRIKLDPWTDQVQLMKSKAVPLLSAREKLAFQVTPFFPHLTRIGAPEKVAQTSTGAAPNNNAASASTAK